MNSEKKNTNFSEDLLTTDPEQRRSPSVLLFENKSSRKHQKLLSESVNAYKTTFLNNSIIHKKEEFTT